MKAPQQALAPGHGYINTHLMRAQQCEDTMNLWCPGGLSSEELDTDSSWKKGDLVTSMCVFLFFDCSAEQGEGSSSLGRWLSQPGG